MQSSITSKTYGTLSEDQQKQVSGLEFVQGLADGTLPLNTMAETLGYDVTEAARGRVVVTAKPNGAQLNPAGTVHGGLAATMLDSCMGLAIRSTLDRGVGSTTLEFKISLLRPITPQTGLIKAEGIVLSCGRRIGTAEGRITDQQGRLLAHGTIVVHDHSGQKLAYVYFEDEPGRRSAAKLLELDEARRIAGNIAKLPELLSRHQTWGVR